MAQKIAAQQAYNACLAIFCKSLSHKKDAGVKVVEWDPFLFKLIKVKIDLTINMFLHHTIKKNPISI